MFTLNMLLFVSSALTLGYASYLLSSKWHLLSTNNSIPIFMFILFGTLLIVSLLGSLGTCRLSKALLSSYACLLILCFALQVAVIVLLVMSSNHSTESWLEHRWNGLSADDKHWIEDELECCGFNEQTVDNTCTDYDDYCEPNLKSYLTELWLIALILGCAIVAFEVAGVSVSCVIIRALNDKMADARFGSYVEYSYMKQEEHDPVRLSYRL